MEDVLKSKVLEVKNLRKQFGDFVAVEDISFSLHKGEILGVLGPNGAGKTTTLQMMLGTLTPTSGSVNYFGMDLSQKRTEILERINFSSTYTNLPWDTELREVLNYTSFLYKIANRKQRLQEVRETFKLGRLWEQQIKELSAGQITRANLAKAFINNPEVVLLDEPTASLDPDIADYIRKFLLRERDEKQTSIVITSHNMAEVEEICDRVIFINHGKIVADDTPINLARQLQQSTLRLLFPKKPVEAEAIARKFSTVVKIDGKRLEVELPETEIPAFLQELQSKDSNYIEIDIEKPTLEDYFIYLSSKNEQK